MSKFLAFLAAMLVSSASANFGLIGKLVSDVENDVRTVKQVVDTTVVTIGSSQCANAKLILGYRTEDYEKSPPDLEALTVNFITDEVKFTYKLSAAAKHLPESHWFNSSRPIIIYLHGFTDDPEKASYTNIGKAFISQGNYNVVALDASSQIGFLYVRASTLVEYIGKELAKLLAALHKDGLEPENIHLVGHSLGSHIAGFTGKTFYQLTGKRVGRISGLDPAGPCFSKLGDDRRLSKEHAEFVFVMHTDMGVYGLEEQIGHVDFYPNGGYQQPDCILQTCSHSRSWHLFAESVVNLTSFQGVSCPDYASFRKNKCDIANTSIMGFLTSPCARGKYYLQTNDKSPYGLGKAGLVYDDERGVLTKIVNGMGILHK